MLTNMDKLYESVAANGPVCVGLDTEISYLPTTDTAKTAGENVVAFNRALIDATKGVLVQTRRHARICALMGIRYFIFAINKMDLAGYSQERFEEIKAQIAKLRDELELANVILIPVSATEGDNVTKASANMPWYQGPTILDYLETVNVEEDKEEGFYLPIQRVCRPNHTFRGFQGQIESGALAVGDTITTLPLALIQSLFNTSAFA